MNNNNLLDHPIVNHMDQAMINVFGMEPKLRTFMIDVETQYGLSTFQARAESLSKAESNIMKFYGINHCTFPDSREIFS